VTHPVVIVRDVARLDPKARAGLPDRAFAYIDSTGQRRLPIHDAAHVRNALARFGQVDFEDDAARERARVRLLQAAKRFRIVPQSVAEAGGHEVEARADEFFAVFAAPRAAVDAAVVAQRAFVTRATTAAVDVRVRIGIHSGYPISTKGNYIGLDVHTASRVCGVGHGGQIVVTDNTREAVRASAPDGIRFRALGPQPLRGLPQAVPLFQVTAKGLPTRFPPLRIRRG
jgi:class 3 adenylate cyclase